MKAKTHPAISTYLLQARFSEQMKDFEAMMQVNEAHVLMLMETKLISRHEGAVILRGLRELRLGGSESLEFDPSLEELYLHVEAKLIEIIGLEVAGQMHTGRSRNDLGATLGRMEVREAVLSMMEHLADFRQAVVRLAREHIETVMPGYTHLQPAQPFTLAYWMSGLLQGLQRDARRLKAVYHNTNLSPLGAAALATTGFPIDRQMTADLLGFDAVLVNGLDAVCSRDYLLEILAALSILVATLSSMAEDLYVWSTKEFGFLRLADEVVVGSSIMPQKRNGTALEQTRAKAGHIFGALFSALACIKNTGYHHNLDRSTEAFYLFGTALREVEAMLAVLEAVLSTVQVNKEKMLKEASEDFSTFTEVADTLVRENQLSFRAAHEIVRTLAEEAWRRDLRANEITAEMIETASEHAIGRPIKIDSGSLASALDPWTNVVRRNTLGGPSPIQVTQMLDHAQREIEADRTWISQSRNRVSEARARLAGLVGTAINA